MGLFEWGIRQMDKVEGNIHVVSKILGFMPLSWRQVVMNDKSRDGLMWRIPDPSVRQASSLVNVQAILVTEQEQVLVLKDGTLGERIILPPGLYDIRRTETLRGQIEVIWFTTRNIQLRWGVGDILTTDRITIGASGTFNTAIVDPVQFLTSVAGNEQVYKESQLLEITKPHVSNAIRNQMSHTSVMEFQQAQPVFEQACYEVLAPRFASLGLEFRGLTVEAQNIPEEFRRSAGRKVIVSMDKEAEIEGAQADVELAKLKAQQDEAALLLEVRRRQLLGNVSINIMQNEMSSGLDPLELQRIEALKILAENPAEGVLVDNRPQIVSQLMPPPPPVTPPINPMIVTLAPAQPPTIINSSPTNVSPTSTPSSGETMSREKIQEMLDKLDERFANSEISEQVYLMLQDKWQKRLAQLP